MTLELLIYLLLPGLIGGLLSFLLEGVLTPRPVPPWRRPAAANLIHAGIWLMLYALELVLFRRPVFAVLNVLVIQILVMLVSNVKYSTLREPFVFTDFEYFLDAIRHPRLYVPFFGRMKAALAAAGYGVVLFAGLTLEDALTGAGGLWLVIWEKVIDGPATAVALLAFWALMAVLSILGGMLAAAGAARPSTTPTFDAVDDLRRLGLTAALWSYRTSERAPFAVPKKNGWDEDLSQEGPSGRVATQPDIVVVQSESFFDARRVFPNIKPEVLARFDALQTESEISGRLRVAAWGANTVRTEFAFLSGLAPDMLGVHRYNPYRKLARQNVLTLARHLEQRGYRTVCVHPYPASFYARSKVYPLMGFETFLDLSAFSARDRFGPYIADAAVASKIDEVLTQNRDDRPVFVFAITMENHGPLHWESVGPVDRSRLFSASPPPAFDDLVAYVRHLANADAMFGALADSLTRHDRPSVLCIYGDHVPIMPAVYASTAEPDGLTDYLVWRPVGQGTTSLHRKTAASLAVEDLASWVLRAAFGPVELGAKADKAGPPA